ncbi:MAG: glycosyltransferase family 2 protein [Methylacidiphilaceae bacterium]|nr:glycosyltransferase family 2 protein [Candidatus Methylacidiphilaceae bacterium]
MVGEGKDSLQLEMVPTIAGNGSERSSVGAVIVTWNSAAWIEGILTLLGQASVEGFRKIVFVDTGSTDGTLALLRAAVPRSAEVIEVANGGYAAGLNAGIRAFGAERPPFFLLLNPDITAEPRFLDRMLREIARHPLERIGIAGTRILEPAAGGGWIEANRRKRNLWGWPIRNSGDPAIAWTDATHGACLLVRREVIEQVGFFDEDYFLYWEEIDYCARTRRAGFQVARIERARVWHHPGEVRAGKNQKSANFYVYFWRNQLLYARKIYGPWVGTLFLLCRAPLWCRDALRLIRAGETALLGKALEGLWMGLSGKTGPALAGAGKAGTCVGGSSDGASSGNA